MEKQNLALIAEGYKLIATAYAREAGIDLSETKTEFSYQLAPEAFGDTKAPTAKPGKVTPKVEKSVEEEVVEEYDDSEETEGYSLDELNGMTVKRLKEIASEIGIKVPKDTKKADIIDMIMDGLEDADEDAEEDAEDVETAEMEEESTEEETDEDEESDEDSDDEDEEVEELTIADVEAMTIADLKELANEYEVDLPSKVTKEKAVQAIVGALFEEEEIEAYYNGDEEAEEAEEADDAEEAEGDEEYLTEADLEEMSLTELKELAKEYEIEHPKVIKADKLRAIISEALFSDEEEEDEDDDSDETDLDINDKAEEFGLNDMSVEELTDLLTEYKIKALGNKQALIAKVLEAIEEGIIEVDEEEGE